jgi:hypothetical protein
VTAALIAADPPTVPPSDGEPPGQPYVSPDDLASVGPLWDEAARRHLDPLVAEIWQDSSDTIHAEMVDVTQVPSLPNVSSLAGEQYLRQAANTFEEVGDELWGVARSELLAGFEAGESIEQLADRLRHSAGLTAKKAVLVARTQIIEASNAASIATARAADLDMQKEWMSAEDRRVRPAHAEANGQRVDLNAKFMVGGYQADYPGDPVLSPALRYSCRCTVGYVMPDKAVKQAHRQAELPLELPNTSGAETAPTVPPSVVEPEPTRAEKRAAARARQKEIATADGNARLLAEVDELAAKKATKKTIQSRLDPALIEPDQLFANADPALLDQLREAVTSTAVARLQMVVGRIAAERGLVPIGEAGARLEFDPATMRNLADVNIPEGELVDVVRQGHIFGTGSDAVQLDQAVVTRATTQEQIQALQDRLTALQDLFNSGETTDEDGGDLEAAISQVQAALVALKAPARKAVKKRPLTASRVVWTGCRFCLNPRHPGRCAKPGSKAYEKRHGKGGGTSGGGPAAGGASAGDGGFESRASAAATGRAAQKAAPFNRDTEVRLADDEGFDDFAGTGVPGHRVRDALADYGDNGHRSVNGALRKVRGDTGKIPATLPGELHYSKVRVTDQVTGLDAAMSQSRLTSDIVVHRGVESPRKLFGTSGDLTGLQFRDHGYASTTTAGKASNEFTGNRTGLQMRILVPKGTGAIGSTALDRNELLLDRALTYKVHRDYKVDGVRTVDVEVVP